MTENNVVTSIEARDLTPDRYAVVVTYRDGERIGCLTTHARLLEMIDGFEEIIKDNLYRSK